MKVLSLNSSPRPEKQSKTLLMLNSLLKGMEEAGAIVEMVNLKEKKIGFCKGCFSCWTKTPGKCIVNDDMTRELLPKFIESDIAVMAFPLYHFTFNACMKAFIERTLPIIEPWLVKTDGGTTHPLRIKHPSVVMLSVAGFPEMNVFDMVSQHSRFIYRDTLIAEIYRPAAEGLPAFKERQGEILEAAAQAGREIILENGVSEETMKRITSDICESGLIRKSANIFWRTCIKEKVMPLEFASKHMVPRPSSIDEFLTLMQVAISPAKTAGIRKSLQFNFTGEPNGPCYLMIDDGKVSSGEAKIENPDIEINAPFDLWMDILTKKTDGEAAFLECRYTVAGDLDLLINMKDMMQGE